MKKKVIVISVLLLIILCINLCSASISDSNDTFYLIKLGQIISKNGIDMIDHFSWIPNLPYTYPHWLYSVFVFFVYNNFGFNGIYISTIVSYAILLLIIYYVNIKINKDAFLALLVGLISVIPLSIFAYPRAQSISIIFLVLEVFFIEQLITTGRKRYILYLSICSLIIANVHATIWIVFFVFFLPFFAEHIVYLYSKKKNKKFSFNGRLSYGKVNNIKLVLIAFIICLVVGVLSPSKICYTYFIRIALGDSQQYIMEHYPTMLIKFPLVIILSVLLFFSKSKIRIYEFLMIFGIILMVLMSQRHLIFFCTIGILYFSIILKRNLDEKKDMTLCLLEKKIFSHSVIPITILVCSSVLCFFTIKNNLNNYIIDEKEYPVAAVKYIKDNLDYKNIKIINDYDHGSYLLFNDIKVFVDSRCDLYYKEFNGKNMSVLDDYFEIFSYEKKYDYDKLLQKYHADYFLIDSKREIYYMLKMDNRYETVYDDGNFGLFKSVNDKI